MKVKIKHSDHSDVRPGAIGEVVGESPKGFAVEITQPFYKANEIQKDPKEETRTIYFTKKQVEILPDDTQGNSPSTDSAREILPESVPSMERIV